MAQGVSADVVERAVGCSTQAQVGVHGDAVNCSGGVCRITAAGRVSRVCQNEKSQYGGCSDCTERTDRCRQETIPAEDTTDRSNRAISTAT